MSADLEKKEYTNSTNLGESRFASLGRTGNSLTISNNYHKICITPGNALELGPEGRLPPAGPPESTKVAQA